MTTKHTPGPWHVRSTPAATDDPRCGVFEVRAGRAGNRDMTVFAEQDANARLIAAAPDTAAERDRLRAENAELRAALERMVAETDYKKDAPAVLQARAVLAKAKGTA